MNKFTASADRIQTLFIQRVLYNRTDSHKEIHMLIYSKDFFFSFIYWAPIDPSALSKSSPASSNYSEIIFSGLIRCKHFL